mmetsp:Transcript_10493/g.14500  ORF Transcript_10493/g.14500 Transcript_10493/m.14500 type:complete len:154 (+) Transcript_10493:297-758(+)
MDDLNSKIPGYLKKIPWYSKLKDTANSHIFKDFYTVYSYSEYEGKKKEKLIVDQLNTKTKIKPLLSLLNHYTFNKTKILTLKKHILKPKPFFQIKSQSCISDKIMKLMHFSSIKKKLISNNFEHQLHLIKSSISSKDYYNLLKKITLNKLLNV